MNAGDLLAHYARIVDAPDAIARLRRFVLDLAVRGKLVAQHSGDEPATQLVEKLRSEKSRLAKLGEGKIERSSGLDCEPAFDIPKSWEWVPATFPAIVSSDMGKKVQTKSVLEDGKFPVVDQGKVFIRGYCNDESKVTRVERPLILFGDHTRETKLIDFDFVVGADGVKLLKPVCILTRYYFMALQWLPLDSRGYGRHFKLLRASAIPLPPLGEQHRIVAKVDELMALCDQLEAARAQREATRDRLAAASLARLNAPDPDSFPADARFALDALPALTTRPDQIRQLRQTILNLAVRGKLVPQDEHEPKASEICLQDVAGRLDISIPQCWRWARVAEVAQARLGKMLDKAKNKGLLYRYLRNTNVHWFEIRTDDLKSIPLSSDELEEYRLQPGDVLICEGGHGIGRTAVWREKLSNIVFQKALHRVRPGSSLDPDFFSYCCFVYFDAGVMQSYFTGVGIPHFTGKGLSRLVIPIPPLPEQHRIVAKVDELMALCDQLEASLTAGESARRRLLDAMLHEALAPVATGAANIRALP